MFVKVWKEKMTKKVLCKEGIQEDLRLLMEFLILWPVKLKVKTIIREN